jgi:GTPase SAR1 family protein
MFIGDSGVGKSLLINSFLSEGSPKMVEPTNGVDIFFKKLKIKDGNATINVKHSLILSSQFGIFLGEKNILK